MSKLILAIDTETNDLPRDWRGAENDIQNWPRIVQLGWVLSSMEGETINRRCVLIRPDGWKIAAEAQDVHGISFQSCQRDGVELRDELVSLCQMCTQVDTIVAHNIEFDWPVMLCETLRLNDARLVEQIKSPSRACTMKLGTPVCRIPGKYGHKWPKLAELHQHLFGEGFCRRPRRRRRRRCLPKMLPRTSSPRRDLIQFFWEKGICLGDS